VGNLSKHVAQTVLVERYAHSIKFPLSRVEEKKKKFATGISEPLVCMFIARSKQEWFAPAIKHSASWDLFMG